MSFVPSLFGSIESEKGAYKKKTTVAALRGGTFVMAPWLICRMSASSYSTIACLLGLKQLGLWI